MKRLDRSNIVRRPLFVAALAATTLCLSGIPVRATAPATAEIKKPANAPTASAPALDLTAATPEQIYNHAVELYRQGDRQQAAELWSRTVAQGQRELDARARFNLGNCSYADALDAVEQDPERAIGQLDTAVTHYRDALAAAPHDQDARTNLELALRLKEQLRQQQEQQQQQNQQQDRQQQDNQQQNDEQQSNDQQQQSGPSQSNDEQQNQGQQQQQQQNGQSSDQNEQQQDQQNQQSSGQQSDQQQDSENQQNDSAQEQEQEQQSNEQQAQSSQSDEQQQDQAQDQQQAGDSGEQQEQQEHEQQSQSPSGDEGAQPEQQEEKESKSAGADQQREEQQPQERGDERRPQSASASNQSQQREQAADQQQQQGASEEPKDPSEADLPEGKLTSAAAAANQPTDEPRNEKEGQSVAEGEMSRQEADKLLQAVRDRDLLRRYEQLRREQARQRPVERDW